MKFDDFKINEVFYSGAGRWVCVDKGQTHELVIAIHDCDYTNFCHGYGAWHTVEFVIFEPDDFPGCDLQDRFNV